jgi:outer membrane receptor protein involved in Fe transport
MMRSLYAGPIALAAFMLPAAALAAPAPSTAAQAAAQPTAPFGAPLDDATMSKTTGRADTSMIAQSKQTSNVSNNTITGDSTTGDVNIENAFQNASGLVLINANSGNNVSMNGSMNVNIIMTGPSPQH